MIDRSIVGCSWITVPAGKYTLTPEPTSTCQIEVDVAYQIHFYDQKFVLTLLRYDNFIAHPAEGEWSKIAPLRILSFGMQNPHPHDSILTVFKILSALGAREYSQHLIKIL